MEKIQLRNGIKAVLKRNPQTPRIAVVLYAKPSADEKIPGLNYLMTELMLQGTKKRSAEELANCLDENAIDINVEKKADYIRIKLLCLNEDVETGLELMSDIVFNSTFENYKKEIVKIKGEFEADLDSPKVRAQDAYYNTIFKNHPYGVGRAEISASLDKITKEDLLEAFSAFKFEYEKNISYTGDIEPDIMRNLLDKYFDELRFEKKPLGLSKVADISADTVSVIKKEDANQAQIFMGRVFPSVYSEYYPKFVLLNTLLGASGLSSRLFLELREKQGLAYTVRSVLESYVSGGDFFVYIATEPSNIKKSVEGFKTELNRVMRELIGEEELANAKSNAIGKRSFYKETNMAEASLNGYYECLGLGCEFEEKLIDEINSATSKELLETAEKFFSTPAVLTVLAPEKYLKEAGLI